MCRKQTVNHFHPTSTGIKSLNRLQSSIRNEYKNASVKFGHDDHTDDLCFNLPDIHISNGSDDDASTGWYGKSQNGTRGDDVKQTDQNDDVPEKSSHDDQGVIRIHLLVFILRYNDCIPHDT